MNIPNKLVVDYCDFSLTIAKQQYNFVRSILVKIGIPLDSSFLPEEYEQYSVDHKIKLRKIMQKFKIKIASAQEELFIEAAEQKIASWEKPEVKILIENGKRKAEITFKIWSIYG